MSQILAQPAGELTQLWYGDTSEDRRLRPDSSCACVSSGGLALANQNLPRSWGLLIIVIVNLVACISPRKPAFSLVL